MAVLGEKFDHAKVKKDLGDEITRGFDAVRERVKTLQGVIDELETGGQWRGVGANAFNSKQVQINERLVHMGQTLAKFLDALEQTGRIKDGTEDAVRAAVQAIDVQHGGAHQAAPPPSSGISSIPS